MRFFSFKQLRGFTPIASDGEIGKVHDVLFDDRSWTVRYLVVDTGGWLRDRLVLLSPLVLGALDEDDETLAINLTRRQVESSPEIDVHAPVGRQREHETLERYGWTPAWVFTGIAGAPPVSPPVVGEPPAPQERPRGDAHLRSAREVDSYSIRAIDGDIGHVDDMIVGDEAWMVRYLVVDTRSWLPGKKVLLSPEWITDVSWADQAVRVDLDREEVRSSPEYRRHELLTREYESQLYEHYDRPPYWL